MLVIQSRPAAQHSSYCTPSLSVVLKPMESPLSCTEDTWLRCFTLLSALSHAICHFLFALLLFMCPPPNHPPHSLFPCCTLTYISGGMRTVKSWWRVGELWFVISLHVKTFIRGRTHHLHTLIIMTRGPRDECVCAWERGEKCVSLVF